MTNLRKAADMALEALNSKYIVNCGAWMIQQDQAAEALRQALAESANSTTNLVEPKAPSQPEQEWDSRHPKAQALIGERARLRIELGLVEQLIDDPHFETMPTDVEYWGPLHDKLKEALTQPKHDPVAWRDHVEQRLLTWRQSFVNRSGDQLALDDFMDKRSIDDLIDFVCDESYHEGKPNYCTPEVTMQVTTEVPCKTHPDAPHGFDRNASHNADRYVCECEGWEPVDETAKHRLIRIMGTFDLATGHADTMDQALDALEQELSDVLGHYRARREWIGLNLFDRTLLRTTYAPLKPLHHNKDTNTDIVAEVVNDWEAFFTAIEQALKEKNT